MTKVCYIFPTSHHYRLPFHQKLRSLLAAQGVEYTVIYSDPGAENVAKKDTVEIDWGVKVRRTNILGKLIYQHALLQATKADLVIVQQENSLLFNYVVKFCRIFNGPSVAYFGHGRNFQARNVNSRAERFKRFWATKADWWFAYTEETKRYLISLGYPAKNITVFNNAVDTSKVRALSRTVTDQDIERRRVSLELCGLNVGVFVGGLYPDKRLEFLFASADLVRRSVPDFELIIVGGGDYLELAQKLASTRPWVRVMGPQFGKDKIEAMRLGKLFLMPGLVGLAILDAAAVGLPTVTTRFPWHSPEIAYLENDVNGVIVEDWENTEAYAAVIIEILRDDDRLHSLREASIATSNALTIEAMAERFSIGVMQALAEKSHAKR